MDYIDRFVYVEPALHLWDEAYLIIMYDFSNVFLDSVCQYFIENFLTGVRWYLKVVLICISLITKEVEHDLKCLLAIRSSSVVNSLFSSVLIS